MTTLTLQFDLDDRLASAYRQAQPREQEDVKKLFERLLYNQFRKQAVEDMIQSMDETGKEAEANGLTEEIIDEILKSATTLSKAEITHYSRPIRENITVDDLAKEQNWQPIDEQKMDAIVKKMDIKEPIELLMAQLTS
jgi:leucyl-tRNA synthetase